MEVSSATAGEGGNREYRQPLFAQVPCICILFRPCFPVLSVSGWLVLLYNVSSYLVVVFRNILWQNRAVFFFLYLPWSGKLAQSASTIPKQTNPRPTATIHECTLILKGLDTVQYTHNQDLVAFMTQVSCCPVKLCRFMELHS